ncbi:hypothetical protein KKY_644 [Pelagibacterium halotolerans B2]|uniref:Uncharacterized protein n=1 Tax=Pelagibacterium halotolerans (strain DSM 22347 / JCM 15775 / CGMCC 1.7692 / B2) TaxID=1082931 RepID=G4RCL1_PELHB|nr:hypothetical protein KKY_644 [Pelagibacterium halotolerans B2]
MSGASRRGAIPEQGQQAMRGTGSNVGGLWRGQANLNAR